MAEKKQSWNTCIHAFNPIQSDPYACTNPEIIKSEDYRVIEVGEDAKKDYPPDIDSYALLYDHKLFHKPPTGLVKILETTLDELGYEDFLKKIKSYEITRFHMGPSENEVIERALAGCKHCKFYEKSPFS